MLGRFCASKDAAKRKTIGWRGRISHLCTNVAGSEDSGGVDLIACARFGILSPSWLSILRPAARRAPCRFEDPPRGCARMHAGQPLRNPERRPEGSASLLHLFPINQWIACSGTHGADCRDDLWWLPTIPRYPPFSRACRGV